MTTELKTVVGLFDDLGSARQAVSDLSQQGFSRDDVSLVANASAEEYSRYFDKEGKYSATAADGDGDGTGAAVATGAGLGALLGGVGGFLLGMSLLPIPGIGPIVAAGPIASTLMGVVGGAVVGGLLGALTGLGVPEEHANLYAEGVRRGGTLVIVKTVASRTDKASSILHSHGPVDVEQRVSSWRESGWSRFDNDAAPYTADQIAAERSTYRTAGGATVGAAGGAAVGAAGGAAVGSVVPGVGTAAGAAGGAVVGGLAGAAGGHEVAKHKKP